MGWWWTGHGDDRVGDPAADAVTFGLMRLAEVCRETDWPCPSLTDVLATLRRVLTGQEEHFLADRTAAEPIGPLVLTGREPVSPGRAAAPGDPLATEIRAILERLTIVYRDALDRKPRLAEVLACFTFALREGTEGVLVGVEGEIDDIVELAS